MQSILKPCPVCGSEAETYPNYGEIVSVFRVCPVCGRYEITQYKSEIVNDNRLAPYLFYHRFVENGIWEDRYHTTMSKELCDEYRKETETGDNSHGHPVHIDEEIIANWFPKTFTDRVDNILLHLNTMIKHIGQSIELADNELLSLLLVDRKEIKHPTGESVWRSEDDCITDAKYLIDYLKEDNYITASNVWNSRLPVTIGLTPKGYSRIDLLQKEKAKGNGALVAMEFGDDTKPLREAIRHGISNAGYNAIFIDEVQHNDFITPELLKYIRDSKFVVVDLTHKNNGAYFEEGYAMGLGKPVIQLCKKGIQLHFDIAQKNTIMWETEDDIPERLENRIKATID